MTDMKLWDLQFHRKFSVNLYRNLRLPLGEMSLYKDWIRDDRGDPYPILEKTGDLHEEIIQNTYQVTAAKGGRIVRLMGDFLPIYTYEFRLCHAENATVGWQLQAGEQTLTFLLSKNEFTVNAGEEKYTAPCHRKTGESYSLTFRQGGVSLYRQDDHLSCVVCDFSVKALDRFSHQDTFSKAKVALFCDLQPGGSATLSCLSFYLSCGISQADLRPMRYEDGTPIYENGRLFVTCSSRLEEQMYQSVLSWNPTTCDFRLEGALLFDMGDGYACTDVASSVVYDRQTKQWYLWHCAFSHGHILARATFRGDPRFGIQIIDTELLPRLDGSDRTAFGGILGDEDPDLCYINGKWNLMICRLNGDRGYDYYRFISDDPLNGFTFADRTTTGGKTGGMLTRFEGEYYFTCGSDFHSRAKYEAYPYDDLSHPTQLRFDYDDGGFRGWGSIFGVELGSRRRYFHLTFDRHNGSKYNWSYGNLYCFEADHYFR